MTAPDRPVKDLIAEAVADVAASYEGSISAGCADVIAAAVVAACREATVAQQAELIGGELERTNVPQWIDTGRPDVEHLVIGEGGTVHDVRFVPSSRVVGSWREED